MLEDIALLPEKRTTIDSPDGISVGRVSLEHRSHYVVITGRGEMPAMPVGRMYYDPGPDGMPVVGDMVEIRILDENPPHAIITSILPRKSLFARKEAGKRTGTQPIAANIDTVFIVCGLDANFSVRRIERYLTLSLESGAQPVIVLTKADICDDVAEKIESVQASAAGCPVYAISTYTGTGLGDLSEHLQANATVALLGSSGVGKSTLTNYLLGNDIQRIQEVRDIDGRGRRFNSEARVSDLIVLKAIAPHGLVPLGFHSEVWKVDAPFFLTQDVCISVIVQVDCNQGGVVITATNKRSPCIRTSIRRSVLLARGDHRNCPWQSKQRL